MTLSLILLHLAAQDPASPPPAPAATIDDVVVVAGPPAPPIDAFGYFQDFCFDGNRLNGRATHPGEESLWVPLEGGERRALQLPESGASAFLLETEKVTLVLRIEEGPDRFLRRHVCSLTVAGRHDQVELVRRMSAAFHGPGTTRHLTHADSYPTLPGWTQLAWAAIPSRRDREWRVFGPARGAQAESGFVVVTEPGFYARSRYVVGEVSFTSAGALPVSVVSLTHLFKP